jgi:hypothetical protein
LLYWPFELLSNFGGIGGYCGSESGRSVIKILLRNFTGRPSFKAG